MFISYYIWNSLKLFVFMFHDSSQKHLTYFFCCIYIILYSLLHSVFWYCMDFHMKENKISFSIAEVPDISIIWALYLQCRWLRCVWLVMLARRSHWTRALKFELASVPVTRWTAKQEATLTPMWIWRKWRNTYRWFWLTFFFCGLCAHWLVAELTTTILTDLFWHSKRGPFCGAMNRWSIFCEDVPSTTKS